MHQHLLGTPEGFGLPTRDVYTVDCVFVGAVAQQATSISGGKVERETRIEATEAQTDEQRFSDSYEAILVVCLA